MATKRNWPRWQALGAMAPKGSGAAAALAAGVGFAGSLAFVAPSGPQANAAARVSTSSGAFSAAADLRQHGPLAAAATAAAGALVAAGAARAGLRQRKSRTCTGVEAQPIQFTDVCDQTGVTLNRYMIEMTKRGAIDADMQSIFNSIREATKVISKLVNRAPLMQAELLGYQGAVNIQGEDQKKLDVITNDVLKKALSYTGKLGTLASEEEDAPVPGVFATRNADGQVQSRGDAVLAETGKYVCVFDPLDGSSNVDAGIAVGTIFGIFKEPEEVSCVLPSGMGPLDDDAAKCVAGTLQPGKALVAAGYALYSCSTELVITVGNGCIGFTLDASIGEYVLTRPSIRIPEQGKIYSMNEANFNDWDKPLQDYVQAIKAGKGKSGERYSQRYIGSMVADVHRTLLYGGIFAYPADKRNVNGKLRLLYEAAPMSFLVEQAGGKAITGHSRVMDIPPVAVHQRVPVILGSLRDVEECQEYFDKCDDPALRQRCENRMKGIVL